MLLSPISMILFYISLVLVTMSATYIVYEIVAAIIRKIRGKRLSFNEGSVVFDRVVNSIFTVFIGSCVLGVVVSGGVKASNINDDLTAQGLQVISIETDGSTVQTIIGGKQTEVLVSQDADGTWRPYLNCRADIVAGAVMSPNCNN